METVYQTRDGSPLGRLGPMAPESPVDGALLGFLRTAFGAPDLEYAEAPAPISGGFDTLIYGFRLSGGDRATGAPLIVRIFRDEGGPWRARQETASRTLSRTPAEPHHGSSQRARMATSSGAPSS